MTGLKIILAELLYLTTYSFMTSIVILFLTLWIFLISVTTILSKFTFGAGLQYFWWFQLFQFLRFQTAIETKSLCLITHGKYFLKIWQIFANEMNAVKHWLTLKADFIWISFSMNFKYLSFRWRLPLKSLSRSLDQVSALLNYHILRV